MPSHFWNIKTANKKWLMILDFLKWCGAAGKDPGAPGKQVASRRFVPANMSVCPSLENMLVLYLILLNQSRGVIAGNNVTGFWPRVTK